MQFSILTPTHNPEWLPRLAASLTAQTLHADAWEWVIVPNMGPRAADLPPLCTGSACFDVHQTRVVDFEGRNANIGALKRFAAAQAQGEILVEVDHDDELTPDCLARLAQAFEDPSVDFCYSNCCEIDAKGQPYTYSDAFGWKYRPWTWNARPQVEMIAFDPTPASFSRIWYAPNHVRAWRRSFYHRIGGHNPELAVLDDHELLCRTYCAGNVQHVDRCLYVQHHHGRNTSRGERNREIQRGTLALHHGWIERLAMRWAALNGLRCVDLCSGPKPPPGYEGADLAQGVDLEKPWPWADGSVALFRAADALEHLRDPIHTMKEAHRCLAPGGWLLCRTPSTEGRGAFQDPTHKSFWNENSFWYYTRAQTAKYIGAPVRFQAVRCYTHFPTPWHKTHQIPYVDAHLLKPYALRTPGRLEI